MTIRKTLRPQKPHETRFTIKQPQHYTQTKAKCGRYTQRRQKTKEKKTTKTGKRRHKDGAHLLFGNNFIFHSMIRFSLFYGVIFLLCCSFAVPCWTHMNAILHENILKSYSTTITINCSWKKKKQPHNVHFGLCLCSVHFTYSHSHIHFNKI